MGARRKRDKNEKLKRKLRLQKIGFFFLDFCGWRSSFDKKGGLTTSSLGQTKYFTNLWVEYIESIVAIIAYSI